MANQLFPFFGNSIVIVALQSTGAMPTSITAWTGSAGNAIKISCFVQGKSEAGINVAKTSYKTNDDSVYAVKKERDGFIKGKIYDRTQSVATWFETGVPAFAASGRPFLVIFNAGNVSAKWKEFFMVADVNDAIMEKDNAVDDCIEVDITSVPPQTALTLTTTQQAAINTALGAATVKGAATTSTIPAAPTTRLVKYTTVS